jgi:hypothetical protein
MGALDRASSPERDGLKKGPTLEGVTNAQYFRNYRLSDAVATLTPLFELPDDWSEQ